jgi:hypothetical protein
MNWIEGALRPLGISLPSKMLGRSCRAFVTVGFNEALEEIRNSDPRRLRSAAQRSWEMLPRRIIDFAWRKLSPTGC